jgi:hypothetical protein
MLSFDLTAGEWTMLALIVALVILPSRLSAIGNALGRLFGPRGS